MMRLKTLAIAATMLTALLGSTPGQAKERYSYGPTPDWNRYKQLGEEALRAKLPNAQNWSVEWPHGYITGIWRHKGRHEGYMTCGRLRTETPSDGRAVVQFLTVIDRDAVKIADISSKESNSLVNVWCHQLITRALPPVAQMEASAERKIVRLGLSLRPVAEGAYIVSVDAEGPAGKSGMAPGMVLTSANGVKLGEMGAAIGNLLESDTPQWRFETVTGDALILAPAP